MYNVSIKSGDKIIFKELFEKEYPRLIRLACYYLEPQDAQDAVQEVFIELWKTRERIKENHDITHWLNISLRNRCLNIIRNNKIKEKVLQNYKSETSEIYEIENVSERIEKIMCALNNLSTECQAVLKLCVFEECSYEEVATRLSISKNTVKYHVKNAYKLLRVMFQKEKILLFLILKYK